MIISKRSCMFKGVKIGTIFHYNGMFFIKTESIYALPILKDGASPIIIKTNTDVYKVNDVSISILDIDNFYIQTYGSYWIQNNILHLRRYKNENDLGEYILGVKHLKNRITDIVRYESNKKIESERGFILISSRIIVKSVLCVDKSYINDNFHYLLNEVNNEQDKLDIRGKDCTSGILKKIQALRGI